MSSLLKKIFGTLAQKPWEASQAAIDTNHPGQTFNLSNQMSAVIIIFGVSSVLFSLIFTTYLYSLPPGQDTTFILKSNLLWINTLVLILVTYYFDKIRRDFNNDLTNKIKQNLILVGVSRTSKTPTCMYLANRGFKVGNILYKGVLKVSITIIKAPIVFITPKR